MKIVGISDTHQYIIEESLIPKGDVLIHAGDFCSYGTEVEAQLFLDWFKGLNYQIKILIPGNHDKCLDGESGFINWFKDKCKELKINYLMDSGIEIDGVKFWGSPWQPEFNGWSFNLPRGRCLDDKWKMIPDNTDVLITHGPPYGILDECPDINNSKRLTHVGCSMLRKHVEKRLSLKAHFFGHIHESHGHMSLNGTDYFNVAICDGRYRPLNSPMICNINQKEKKNAKNT